MKQHSRLRSGGGCFWYVRLCFAILPQCSNGGNDGSNAGEKYCGTNGCGINEPCCTIEKQKESRFLLTLGKDGKHKHHRTNDGEQLQYVVHGDCPHKTIGRNHSVESKSCIQNEKEEAHDEENAGKLMHRHIMRSMENVLTHLSKTVN